MSEPMSLDPGRSLAIVGMACRVPGAADTRRFWDNLRRGIESISFFSEEELLAAGLSPQRLSDPALVRARGVVEDAEMFDAAFFGYSPREAQVMDPQHRLFLECTWEALEDAGCDPARAAGPIGVFAGMGRINYLHYNVLPNRDLVRSVGAQQAIIANDKDFLPTQVSYRLDLRGPSVGVQTACSTSLVAIHLACQSLLTYGCDLAVAGAVSVLTPQTRATRYRQGGVFSPDGHCRAFDAAAEGTVPGGGVGVVALKRLDDALADGDPIRAVIRGSAINNDGSAKAGFTAPSVDGQAEVVALAQALAGVEPGTVSYVEAHGTGTTMGDPIEVQALREAFGDGGEKTCALGSVKTNLGHLDTAAGVAGVIKTALALEHRELPPSLHYTSPNPKIDFEGSPFYVNAELRPWDTGGSPRRAGVSSFGIGGTNAHVVMEEAPPRPVSGASRPAQLLVLSARSRSALEHRAADLAEVLERDGGPRLADVAYTLQTGRRKMAHRRALVVADREEALAALRGDTRSWIDGAGGERRRPVVFLLPGLGDHYPGMARGLYAAEPVFRQHFDRCADLLAPRLGVDLRHEVFGDGGGEATGGGPDLRRMLGRGGAGGDEAARERLRRTAVAHPAVFAVEYALARLWMDWGVEPEAMLGYSLGEYVAACLAGVFELEDALDLVAGRAERIQQLPGGSMLAVPLPEAELASRLGDELSLAAVNGPSLSVVAGPAEAVDRFATDLDGEGIAARPLLTSHAFHSHMMRPLADELAEHVAQLAPKPPRVPWISNLTGTWIRDEQATDPAYWAEHLCRPVRFHDGVRELWRDPSRILLETGPGQALTSLALQSAEGGGEGTQRLAVPSLRHGYDPADDQAFLLRALGRLWVAGVEPDWARFYADERRHKVSLPTYPFERQRFWAEAPARRDRGVSTETAAADERRPDPAQWFYAPSWSQLPLPQPAGDGGPWLLLADSAGVADRLAGELRRRGDGVTLVRAGSRFEHRADGEMTVAPDSADDLGRAVAALPAPPRRVLHLWSLDLPTDGAAEDRLRAARRLVTDGVGALTAALARAADASPRDGRIDLVAVTRGAARVESGDRVYPEQAPLAALSRVVRQEEPLLASRWIDLAPGDPQATEVDAERLIAVAQAGPTEAALRGDLLWAGGWHAAALPAPDAAAPLLPDGAVVLVTGGLGRLGRTAARALARRARLNLVLTGRTPLPPRDEWPRRIAAGDPSAARLAGIQELEEMGAEVLPAVADVADEAAMADLLHRIDERFGRLDGVLHAAGLTADTALGLVREADAAALDAHFRPKAEGLLVLDRLLASRPLAFRLLLSSVSTLLGGLRLGPYSAANAYLDAWAQASAPRAGAAWLSLDWGEVFSEAEVGEVLARALAVRGARRLAVSPTPLQPRLERWAVDAAGASAQPTPPAAASVTTVSAGTEGDDDAEAPESTVSRAPYAAPESDAEQRIAEIWSDLLGVERIGRHDNFFELGGHSLLAIQLLGRLGAAFEVEATLRDVFESPTLSELAFHVEELVLAELEELGDEEPAARQAPAGRGVVTFEPEEGLVVATQNRVEAEHFYHDIFVDRIYDRGGVQVDDLECVFDVGANIGTFALWIARRSPAARLFCFEPAPPLYELLSRNLEVNGVRATPLNLGVADREDLASFTYYPHSSGMSSFHADVEEEQAVLRTMMVNQREDGVEGMDEVLQHSEELLQQRFRGQSYVCQRRPLSAVIREHGVERVDLLKIDVQKAELEVLRGLEDEDWQRVRQIVIEVHDLDGRLQAIRRLLAERGFQVEIEQEPSLRGTVLYNLFAVRGGGGPAADRAATMEVVGS